MKKYAFVLFISLLIAHTLRAQVFSSAISITKTYSPNGNYYVQCTPYDNEEPSLRGKAVVYTKNDQSVYTLNRGFNGIRESGNTIILSNDGNTITYIINAYADEKTDGLKTVSIYYKGQLAKSFTLTEITGCDPQNERCSLLYMNEARVIDFDKSGAFTKNYHKVFKDSVSDEEKFLNEHALASFDDKLYLTDPHKQVHIIDLKKRAITGNVDFESIYPQLKNNLDRNTTTYQRFEYTNPPDKSFFPNLINGDTTGRVLAKVLGMKAVYVGEKDYFKYKVYRVSIEDYISRDGSIDIQRISADKKLPLDTITQFFKSHKYDISYLPTQIDKWYFRYFFCAFRNKSDEQALSEKQEDERDAQLLREKKMTMDSINGVYIPRNLEECFVQLDKTLPNVAKNEMMALKSSSDMIQYHLSLGMWMRNNWSLWGGSRLVQYFRDRVDTIGVGIPGRGPDPEGMSSVILLGYYDWLKGNKNAAKEWEEKNPVKGK